MYLFTDFDGVLHPNRFEDRDFRCLPLLLDVLDDFDEVQIVISSAWKDRYSLEELKTFLGCAADRVVGVTPSFSTSYDGIRSDEVKLFMKLKGDAPWLALDDLVDHFREQDRHKVIVTHGDTGLTEADMTTLRAYLLNLLAG